MLKHRFFLISVAGLLLVASLARGADNTAPEGFVSLFNGKDFTGWKVPEGDDGHWKVVDGVIDYDAGSQAKGSKDLWSDREYGDFVLQVDWRLKEAPFINKNIPYILPDGTHAKDIHGKELRIPLPDADSGVFLRGDGFYQANIWCWPIGSGEMYSIRTDRQDIARAARGRHAQPPGRQAGGRMEPFRDHRQGQDRPGRVERENRHRRGHHPRPFPTTGASPSNTTAARIRRANGLGLPAWCSSRISISKN